MGAGDTEEWNGGLDESGLEKPSTWRDAQPGAAAFSLIHSLISFSRTYNLLLVGAATMESMEGPCEKESYRMVQKSHSWAYIWRKSEFKRHLYPDVHCSTIGNG